jgi:hypothetical protein
LKIEDISYDLVIVNWIPHRFENFCAVIWQIRDTSEQRKRFGISRLSFFPCARFCRFCGILAKMERFGS